MERVLREDHRSDARERLLPHWHNPRSCLSRTVPAGSSRTPLPAVRKGPERLLLQGAMHQTSRRGNLPVLPMNTPAPKRLPGRPRKPPTVILGVRISAPLAARLKNHVAPHHRRPWLEKVIEAQFPK